MEEWSFGRALLEVRHPPNPKFIDRRGEVADRLLQLDCGFVVSKLEPGLLGLASAAGIAVSCTIENFSITHERPRTGVQLEDLAAKVFAALRMHDHATRVGVRFFVWWPVTDLETAWRIVTRSKLASLSEQWQTTFGTPQRAAPVAFVPLEGGDHVRVELTVAAHRLTNPLPSGWLNEDKMRQDLPPWAVQLDLDFVQESATPFPTTSKSLKEFVRTSWRHASGWAKEVNQLLDFETGEDR